MFIHLGGDVVVPAKDIIAIMDVNLVAFLIKLKSFLKQQMMKVLL